MEKNEGGIRDFAKTFDAGLYVVCWLGKRVCSPLKYVAFEDSHRAPQELVYLVATSLVAGHACPNPVTIVPVYTHALLIPHKSLAEILRF